MKIQQMDVQTYFFRRTNSNALGQPRSWTDHLLWHHAAHTVDLFRYQTGAEIIAANALQGPIHPQLGIAMDLSIQLKAANGAICTLSLSFNNEGPLGTFFRYICDNGTYVARYDDLIDGRDKPIDVSKVDVSMNGIELQDREFFAAHRRATRTEFPVSRKCCRVTERCSSLTRRSPFNEKSHARHDPVAEIGFGLHESESCVCNGLRRRSKRAPYCIELWISESRTSDTAALYGFGRNEELVGPGVETVSRANFPRQQVRHHG